MLTISKRGAIQPFLAMDVMARANALEKGGQRIVHMEVGQPGSACSSPGARSSAKSPDRWTDRLYRCDGDRAAEKSGLQGIMASNMGCLFPPTASR